MNKKGDASVAIILIMIAGAMIGYDFQKGNGFEKVQLKDRCGLTVDHADLINSKTKQCP